MQSDSLADAREICADGTYFPNKPLTFLWLVHFTFDICSKKCEVQTTSHQQLSLKQARCPPCPTHLPRGWNCKSWGWNGKAIYLHTGRSHCKWLLLHNFALMQLQNLHHIWINATIFSLMQFHDSCASLSSAGGSREWHHCHTFSQMYGLITSVI